MKDEYFAICNIFKTELVIKSKQWNFMTDII